MKAPPQIMPTTMVASISSSAGAADHRKQHNRHDRPRRQTAPMGRHQAANDARPWPCPNLGSTAATRTAPTPGWPPRSAPRRATHRVHPAPENPQNGERVDGVAHHDKRQLTQESLNLAGAEMPRHGTIDLFRGRHIGHQPAPGSRSIFSNVKHPCYVCRLSGPLGIGIRLANLTASHPAKGASAISGRIGVCNSLTMTPLLRKKPFMSSAKPPLTPNRPCATPPEYHRLPTRKIAVTPTKPLSNQRDLALAYSPGVAYPCLAIEQDPGKTFDYTSRGNWSPSSPTAPPFWAWAISAPGFKPVMEGKGLPVQEVCWRRCVRHRTG